MKTGTCPLKHRTPTQTRGSETLCLSHQNQIESHLQDISRIWKTLPDLATQHRTGTFTSGYNSTPPVRLEILALTDPHTRSGEVYPAARALLWLTRWLCYTRKLGPVRTPETAIRVLLLHHCALASHPHPTQLYQVVRATWTALRSAAGETTRPLGYCQEPPPPGDTANTDTDTDSGQEQQQCGGPLLYTPTSLHPVTCARCGDTWSAGAIRLALAQMDLTPAQ